MKTTRFAVALTAFAVGYALLLPSLSLADAVVEEIIARVNNEIVTRSEYVRSRDQLKQEVQQQDPSNADRDFSEKQKDVLRDLIDQQLLLQKGKDLRKEMKLDTMEELEKAAEAQGASYEEFKQNLRNQIVTQRVIGQEVGSHLALNKEDEKKFYELHRAEMERPEQVRLSEILIAPKTPGKQTPPKPTAAGDTAKADPPSPSSSLSQTETDAALAAAQAKAQDVLDQIHKGAKFEDLAKKLSDGPSAKDGGDLSYFKRGTLAKELEDKVFAMKAGDITDVIRTKQGYVILQVKEHQTAGIPTLKEVEPRIQDALYMQKLQPALRAYLTTLRENAFIDIKTGYIDTGASAKQTKPVETTLKEDKAKKLKKKKKLGVF
jgi:peptidyl-prolyl cis-trans isomerase SurA